MDREVDWVELPNHILSLIADNLINIKDYIRFSTVCKSWRSFYAENQHPFRRQLPLLMIPTELNHVDHDCQTRSFYSLTEKRVSNFEVPVPHNLFCPGSSHGWLVTVSPDYEVSLLNPFISHNNEIQLPPLTKFELNHRRGCLASYLLGVLGFLVKVVLSANPAKNPNYVAMAIYGASNRLAFFKPGDEAWTSLPSPSPKIDFGYDGPIPDVVYNGPIQDVIYCRDKFYVVDDVGQVFAWDVKCPCPRVSRVSVSLPSDLPSPILRRYLVESSGQLLQVLRCTEFEDHTDPFTKSYFNAGFQLFKLDPLCLNWIEIDNLEGHALFLGHNSSLSLLASDFSECKPNSIYFTDDYYEGYIDREQFGIGPHDMGVFNVEDGTTELHYPTESKMIIPAPIWIEPML